MINTDVLGKVKPLLETRITTLAEVKEWVDFLIKDEIDDYDSRNLFPKFLTDADVVEFVLYQVVGFIEESGFDGLEDYIRHLAEKRGRKAAELFWPIRVAISGKTVSLPLFQSMEILGKEKCLGRLGKAIEKIKNETDKKFT